MTALLPVLLLTAQEYLTGVITYPGGVPAEQVKVVATMPTGDSYAHTNSEGKYDLQFSAGRPTHIVVEQQGCETITRKFTGQTSMDFQLSKETKLRGISAGTITQSQKLLVRTKPEYPQELRAQGIEGDVQLIAIVAKDGSLKNLRAADTKQPHQGLINAALRAVASWKYRPTFLGCEPVEVVAPIRVSFSSKSTAM